MVLMMSNTAVGGIRTRATRRCGALMTASPSSVVAGIIFPIDRHGPYRRNHLRGGHLRAGWNFDPLLVAGGQHLHMRAADVDDQNSHAIIRRWSCANQPGRIGFVIAWYIISSLRNGGP